MNKLKHVVKNTLITIAPAVIVYLLFFAATNLFGEKGFGVGGDLKTILWTTIYSGFIALAMSYNLTSGRFDFSVGSVLLLSVIAGGNVAAHFKFGPVMLLVCVLVVGMLCGLVSGIVYITLKLPPMVSSLGVAMVFEAIGFTINKGKGIRFLGRFDLLIWSQPKYSLLLVGVVLIILIYLLNFTKFGYNCHSLKTGQKNAVEVGVNENINSVICYVIAGAMMACAGLLYLCRNGMVAPEAGLASSSYMMSAFLPMFIGQALAPYSDRNIGTMVGAFCQACLTSGLVKLGCGSSMKTVLDGAVVLLFLVYTSNSYKFSLHLACKAKMAQALQAVSAAINK
ncbi:MAG: hypothetical protein PUB51_04325 [Oscillospiraceae bacterium]|nr:hypothetical protein [Oscillospiraceae bacterium]